MQGKRAGILKDGGAEADLAGGDAIFAAFARAVEEEDDGEGFQRVVILRDVDGEFTGALGGFDGAEEEAGLGFGVGGGSREALEVDVAEADGEGFAGVDLEGELAGGGDGGVGLGVLDGGDTVQGEAEFRRPWRGCRSGSSRRG